PHPTTHLRRRNVGRLERGRGGGGEGVRRLLRTPGVARLITSQLVARFPGGMLSLGILLHIERIFDSYAAAGAVLAALSVGQAVAGPLPSRWMGVWRMRPVLIRRLHRGAARARPRAAATARLHAHRAGHGAQPAAGAAGGA